MPPLTTHYKSWKSKDIFNITTILLVGNKIFIYIEDSLRGRTSLDNSYFHVYFQVKKVVSGRRRDSVILETETNLQGDDKVQWWYHDDHDLIAEINGETKHNTWWF